ncbi:MAG: hypothetical protein ACI3YK_01825 [Eubacteriales bacterium]
MKRRLIASLFCAVLLASTAATLASCADTGNGGTTTTPGSDLIDPNNGEIMYHVPDDVRFDGEIINFAVAETDHDGFHKRSIKLDDTDDTESNKVDSAVAQRNAAVESRLGVTIELLGYFDSANIRSSAVYNSLAAQDGEYDVIAGLQWNDVQLCTEGFLADLTCEIDDYPGQEGQAVHWLGYEDEPYWSNYYVDAMKCGDSVYWLTGDLCLRYTGGFYCFFVNSKLYEESLMYTESNLLTQKYGTPTTYGDIYQLVKNGDWTLDVLNEMVAKVYMDDGDDKVGRTDKLGAAMPVWDNTNGLSIAAGVEYSARSGDTIVLTATNTNATLIDFMTKISTILRSGYVYNYGGDYATAMQDFASDNACFVSGRLNQAELYLTDMTTNYHIIPCPKLDFTQENYRSSVHDGINLYGINYFSEHKAATAATLELMAYYSYTTVRPIYYDEALKNMYTNDKGAADMIDLMGEVVYSDFVYIWQFADVFYGLGDFLRNHAETKRPSSDIAKVQDAWKKGLESVLEEIAELEAEKA